MSRKDRKVQKWHTLLVSHSALFALRARKEPTCITLCRICHTTYLLFGVVTSDSLESSVALVKSHANTKYIAHHRTCSDLLIPDFLLFCSCNHNEFELCCQGCFTFEKPEAKRRQFLNR